MSSGKWRPPCLGLNVLYSKMQSIVLDGKLHCYRNGNLLERLLVVLQDSCDVKSSHRRSIESLQELLSVIINNLWQTKTI